MLQHLLVAASLCALTTVAYAAPQIDPNAGTWTDAYRDTAGINSGPGTFGIFHNPFTSLVTIATDAATACRQTPCAPGEAPGRHGQLTTTLITPTSASAWGAIYVKATVTQLDDLQLSFITPGGQTFGPFPLLPSDNPAYTAMASLGALSPATTPEGRVVLALRERVVVQGVPDDAADRPSDDPDDVRIRPSVSGLRVTWSPRSVVKTAVEAPPSLCSGDTIATRIRVAVSLVDATDLVVYSTLPTLAPDVVGRQNPLTFLTATDGGTFTSTAISVHGVTIPANSVVWQLGTRKAGTTFVLSYTTRSPNGSLTGTAYPFTAGSAMQNGLATTAPAATTTLTANPAPRIDKRPSGAYLINNVYYARPGQTLGYSVYAENRTSGTCGEAFHQTVVIDNVSDLTTGFNGGPIFTGSFTISNGGVYTATATTIDNVSVPAHSIYWRLNTLEVGTSSGLSYSMTLRSDLPDGHRVDNTATVASGFRPNRASASAAVVIGIPNRPTGSYAKGDKIFGVASISAGQDNTTTSVTYGDPITFLLAASNAGASALNATWMVDKIPAGVTFTSAFLPASASGTLYYNVNGADAALNAPPDWDMALGAPGSSWTTTPPTPASNVRWIAVHIPKLASSYFPEAGIPSSAVAEISVTVDIPAEACPSFAITNRGLFQTWAYTKVGETTPTLRPQGDVAAWVTNDEDVWVRPVLPSFVDLNVGVSPGAITGTGDVTFSINIPNQHRDFLTEVDTALDVVATLTLPKLNINGVLSPLPFVSVSAPGASIDYTGLPNTLTLRYATIAPRTARTATATFHVPRGYISGQTTGLSAQVSGRDDVCGPISASAGKSLPVTGNPYLQVAKHSNLGIASPTSDVTYTLTYTSAGDAASTGTWVVDRIPDGASFVSAEVPPHQGQVWFSTAQPPLLPTSLRDETFTFTDAIVRANFVPGTLTAPGEMGPPAPMSNPRWIAFLVDNTTLTPAQLPVDTLNRVRWVASIDSGTAFDSVIRNDAAILSRELLPAVSNTATTVVSPKPSLDVLRTCGDVVRAGETFSYTVDWINNSTNNDYGVRLVETLPAGVTFIHAAHAWNDAGEGLPPVPAPTWDATARTLTWDIGQALGGEPVGALQGGRLTVTVQTAAATPSGTLIDLGGLALATDEGHTLDLSLFTGCRFLVENADLFARIGVDEPAPVSGETVTLSVIVSNEGRNSAEQTVLTLALPAGLNYVPGSTIMTSAGWAFQGNASEPVVSSDGRTLTWSPALNNALGQAGAAPGFFPGRSGQATLVFQAQVAPTVPAATTLTTSVTIATPSAEDAVYANTASVTLRTPRPDLYVQKTAPPFAQPGDSVTYRIRYGNHSRQPAQDVVLIDRLFDAPPANGQVDVTFIGATASQGETLYFNAASLTGPAPAFNPTDPAASGWRTAAAGAPVHWIAVYRPALAGLAGPASVFVEVELRNPVTDILPQPGASIENIASISFPGTDDHPEDNTSNVITRTPGIDIAAALACTPEGAYPGLAPKKPAAVTLELQNLGTVTAYGLKFTWQEPAWFETLSTDAAAASATTAQGLPLALFGPTGAPLQGAVPLTRVADGWLIGDTDPSSPTYFRKVGLPAGGQVRLTVSGSVRDAVQNDTAVSQALTVSTAYHVDFQPGIDEEEEITTNNAAQCQTVVYRADPMVRKRAATPNATPPLTARDQIRFTIEYNNIGGTAADDVLIEDNLPEDALWVIGSLADLPEGTHASFDDGSGSFTYTPTGEPGRTDPAVRALRVTWDTPMPAPAGATFAQKSALDFQSGTFDNTTVAVGQDGVSVAGQSGQTTGTYTSPVIPTDGANVLSWGKIIVQSTLAEESTLTISVIDADTQEVLASGLTPDASGALPFDLDAAAHPRIQLRADLAGTGMVCDYRRDSFYELPSIDPPAPISLTYDCTPSGLVLILVQNSDDNLAPAWWNPTTGEHQELPLPSEVGEVGSMLALSDTLIAGDWWNSDYNTRKVGAWSLSNDTWTFTELPGQDDPNRNTYLVAVDPLTSRIFTNSDGNNSIARVWHLKDGAWAEETLLPPPGRVITYSSFNSPSSRRVSNSITGQLNFADGTFAAVAWQRDGATWSPTLLLTGAAGATNAWFTSYAWNHDVYLTTENGSPQRSYLWRRDAAGALTATDLGQLQGQLQLLDDGSLIIASQTNSTLTVSRGHVDGAGTWEVETLATYAIDTNLATNWSLNLAGPNLATFSWSSWDNATQTLVESDLLLITSHDETVTTTHWTFPALGLPSTTFYVNAAPASQDGTRFVMFAQPRSGWNTTSLVWQRSSASSDDWTFIPIDALPASRRLGFQPSQATSTCGAFIAGSIGYQAVVLPVPTATTTSLTPTVLTTDQPLSPLGDIQRTIGNVAVGFSRPLSNWMNPVLTAWRLGAHPKAYELPMPPSTYYSYADYWNISEDGTALQAWCNFHTDDGYYHYGICGWRYDAASDRYVGGPIELNNTDGSSYVNYLGPYTSTYGPPRSSSYSVVRRLTSDGDEYGFYAPKRDGAGFVFTPVSAWTNASYLEAIDSQGEVLIGRLSGGDLTSTVYIGPDAAAPTGYTALDLDAQQEAGFYFEFMGFNGTLVGWDGDDRLVVTRVVGGALASPTVLRANTEPLNVGRRPWKNTGYPLVTGEDYETGEPFLFVPDASGAYTAHALTAPSGFTSVTVPQQSDYQPLLAGWSAVGGLTYPSGLDQGIVGGTAGDDTRLVPVYWTEDVNGDWKPTLLPETENMAQDEYTSVFMVGDGPVIYGGVVTESACRGCSGSLENHPYGWWFPTGDLTQPERVDLLPEDALQAVYTESPSLSRPLGTTGAVATAQACIYGAEGSDNGGGGMPLVPPPDDECADKTVFFVPHAHGIDVVVSDLLPANYSWSSDAPLAPVQHDPYGHYFTVQPRIRSGRFGSITRLWGCSAGGGATLDSWQVLYRGDRDPSFAYTLEVPNVCQSSIDNNVAIMTSSPEITTANNQDAASVAVATTDLRVTVTPDRGVVYSDDVMSFTATVTNAGTNTARDVVLTMRLPDGDGDDRYGATFTYPVGTLAPGETRDFTEELYVWTSEPFTQLTATAAATTSSIDCESANNRASGTALTGDLPNAYVHVTGPQSLPVGTDGTWTVTFGNDGTTAATHVVLTVALPTGMTWTDVTIDGEPLSTYEDCAIADDVLTCTSESIWPDNSEVPPATITLTGRRDTCDNLNSSVSLTADVASDLDINVNDNHDAVATRVTAPAADLRLSVFPGRGTAEPGSTLTYVAHYRNAGVGPATGLTLTLPVPAGATFLADTASAGATFDNTTTTLTWTLPTLGAGEAGSVSFAATLSGAVGTALSAQATLAATAGACPVTAAYDVARITPPGLHLTKQVSAGAACDGELSWLITATNTGATPQANLVVTDRVAAASPYLSGSIQGRGGSQAGAPVLTWNIGTLAPGEAVTLGYRTQQPSASGALISNVATLEQGGTVHSQTAPVVARAGCDGLTARLTKAWSAACTTPGAPLTVTLNVTNTSRQPLVNATVSDPVQAGLTFVSSDTLAFDATTGRVSAAIALLQPGQSKTFTWTASLAADLAPGNLVLNTAQLTAAGRQPQVSNQVTGVIQVCDDGDPCTTDTCQPFVGCVATWTPRPEVADNTCNGQDDNCDHQIDEGWIELETTCGVGVCARTGSLTCPAGATSPVDTCAAGTPESATDGTCDGRDDNCSGEVDEDYDTLTARPVDCGRCFETATTRCELGQEVWTCTAEVAGTTCDDDNACSSASTCDGAGGCLGRRFIACNDQNTCTDDSCDPTEGCVFTAVTDGKACDDGNACTNEDSCTAGTCGGAVIGCAEPNACQEEGVCNPATGVCDFAQRPGDLPVPIRMRPLGTLGGAMSTALAVNAAGQVVGHSDDATGELRAFSWTVADGMTDLGPGRAIGVNDAGLVAITAPDGVYSWSATSGLTLLAEGEAPAALGPTSSGFIAGRAGSVAFLSVDGLTTGLPLVTDSGDDELTPLALSNTGYVVGFLGDDDAQRAFRADASGEVTVLTTPAAAEARAVNSAGEAVGWALNAQGVREAAFFAADGTLTLLGGLGGESWATAINDAGRVIGTAETATQALHAFTWTADAGLIDLGTLGGDDSAALFLTADDLIAGFSDTALGAEATFLWREAAGMSALDLRGALGARPVGVSASGVVAGTLRTSTTTRAFLWDALRGTVDLGTLGGASSTAFAVSATGRVVGEAQTVAGMPQAFLSDLPQTACVVCEEDHEPPTLICPQARRVFECAAEGVGVDLGSPSVSDACGQAVVVTSDAPETYPAGTTTVTFTATDSEGNQATCTTTVTVSDTQAPEITCPEPVTVASPEGQCGATVTLAPEVRDGCGEVTILGPNGVLSGPLSFPSGTTEVTFTAVDPAGNRAECVTSVTVTVPVLELTCDEERTVDAPADFCGFPEALSAVAIDACQGEITVQSASESFPIGVTNVHFTAENARGDDANCTTRLTVRDVTAPTVTCGITEANAVVTAPSAFTPVISDACTATHRFTNARCVVVDDGAQATEVTEGCVLETADNGSFVINQVPERDAQGAFIATGHLQVRWTVIARDPSGNETTQDCQTGLDLSLRDRDRDGIPDDLDNCPDIANADQLDTDLDGIGDVCDGAPYDGLRAEGSGGCQSGDLGGGLLAALGLLGLAALRRRRPNTRAS